MAKKYWIGFLVLVILSASIYIMLPDKIRIDIQKTRTQYRIDEDDSWILSATEYVNLFDGSAKMRAKNRSLDWFNDSGIITVSRIANYKEGISTIETYEFDSTRPDVELVPVTHIVRCRNCKGKILHFEYRDILYTRETKDITSPFSFGHKMKLEWQDGSYRSKVYQQKVASDKIIIRYRPESDYESFYVRLFDPVLKEGEEMIGTKIVKELCVPLYRNRTEEIKHYKTCFQPEVYNEINKTTSKAYNYTCLDFIEKIEYLNEQFDCVKTGVVNVSNKIYSSKDRFCKLEGTRVCCISEKEGGRWNYFKKDGSVGGFCEDLITGKKVYADG